MADILSSIRVLINVLFNGKSKVKTFITVREYKHKFTFIRETGELRYLVLICREYEHKEHTLGGISETLRNILIQLR